MDLFNCYNNMFKDEKTRKKMLKIERIRYNREKALRNRVAKEIEVMKSFSEIIEDLPEDERKRVLEDARQSAKEQQERLAIVQHQQWEKERNIKHGYIQNN